jgi:hypothetical protein
VSLFHVWMEAQKEQGLGSVGNVGRVEVAGFTDDNRNSGCGGFLCDIFGWVTEIISKTAPSTLWN